MNTLNLNLNIDLNQHPQFKLNMNLNLNIDLNQHPQFKHKHFEPEHKYRSKPTS